MAEIEFSSQLKREFKAENNNLRSETQQVFAIPSTRI